MRLVYVPAAVVTIVLLLTLPLWPWSRGWTWVPAGMIGMIAGIVWLVTLVEITSTA